MDTGPPSPPLFAFRATSNTTIPHMPLSYTGSTATNDTVSNQSSALLIITLVLFLSSALMFSAAMIWLYFRRKALINRVVARNRNEQRTHHHIVSIPSIANNNIIERRLDWLPVFTFSSITGANEQLDCVVCLSIFEAEDRLKRLPCFHAFHVGCIDAWYKYKQTCPLCRSAINPITEQADHVINQIVPSNTPSDSFRIEIGTSNPRLDFSDSDSSYSSESVEFIVVPVLESTHREPLADGSRDYLDRDSAESSGRSENLDGYEANHGGIGVEINEYLSGV